MTSFRLHVNSTIVTYMFFFYKHVKFRNRARCRLCDCDLSCLQFAVFVAVIASYVQSGSREWHPSGRPRRTYNLLLIRLGYA